MLFRKMVSAVALTATLGACSTNGGFYKENDPQNGQFSILNTMLLPLAIAGAVVGGAAMGAAMAEPEPTTVVVVNCRSRYRC